MNGAVCPCHFDAQVESYAYQGIADAERQETREVEQL